MAYNLIDERWIPVERRSGKVELIAPAQVVERDDPPLRIASPRPDFDGALLEFLIGLLQTAAAPATEREWERQFDAPPSVEVLKKRLDTVHEAFFLDGDGPRFMQDLTVGKDPKASCEPIGALLIDRIGESGLEESPTLFAKPGRFEALGYPAVAAALMALQTYAPAGGRGQLTSLRGGGPLTTLVTAEDLWTTAWLNVLPMPEFVQLVPGEASNVGSGAIFPWMAPTRTSETKGGKQTPPNQVHPLQNLWGLPRRFRLDLSNSHAGACAVSGAEGVAVVEGYLSRPDGTSYDGDYRHPWSPYTLVKPSEPWNPKKGSSEGLPYRDWPLLVVGSTKQRPATVVSYFASTRRRDLAPRARLVAFGYAMENMKPLRWCRAETPIITVAQGLEGYFAEATEGLVAASDEVRKTLSAQVKAAWSDRPAGIDVFSQVNPAFWSSTEAAFFTAVQAVKAGLESHSDEQRDTAKEAWLDALHRAALGLFDRFVDASTDLAAPELRRAVVARRALEQFTRPSSPKLRKLLVLLVDAVNNPGMPAKARTKKKESTP
jgi:CRISPR system Cascade subunit CasA